MSADLFCRLPYCMHGLQNPLPRSTVLAVGIFTLLLTTRAADAQLARKPLVQVALGVGSSTGGDYVERDDYTAELLLAQPIRGHAKGGLAFGVVAGTTFANGSDLTCRMRPDGSCAPVMPRFGYLAAVVGYERVGMLGAVSLAVGPSVASATGNRHPGLLYRADVSTPAVQHVAGIVSWRGVTVTGVEGSTLALRSVQVGVRIR